MQAEERRSQKFYSFSVSRESQLGCIMLGTTNTWECSPSLEVFEKELREPSPVRTQIMVVDLNKGELIWKKNDENFGRN